MLGLFGGLAPRRGALCVLGRRRAGHANLVEVRSAVNLAAGLGLEARFLVGRGHAVKVGVREAMLGHEFVDVYPNHLSSTGSLGALLLGSVVPLNGLGRPRRCPKKELGGTAFATPPYKPEGLSICPCYYLSPTVVNRDGALGGSSPGAPMVDLATCVRKSAGPCRVNQWISLGYAI